MKQVTLPKKFERSYGPAPYVYNEKWISNGHFAVKKELIKDCVRYCVDSEQAKVDIDRIIPEYKSSFEWIKTDRLFDKGKLGYLRVFECKQLNKEVCFKEEYVKHFNLNKLYGECEQASFLNETETLLIMPCRK
jgi:hypothetical protein